MHKAIDVALNVVLSLLVLLIVVGVGRPFVIYWREQPHQREIQEKGLNANFAQVKFKGGRVMLMSNPHNHLFKTSNGDYFHSPRFLSEGSQFKASDRHWGATYTISSIDPDGVNIYFDADGISHTTVRRSSGTVKLLWK